MYRAVSSVPSRFVNVESTIRGLSQDFCTAFNTGNFDQAAGLFTAEGVVMPPERDLVTGLKAIENVLRQLAESGQQDLRLETLRVDHSDDIAVEIGGYTLSIHNSDRTTTIERGKYLHSWRRLGVWLMTANCWNRSLGS
jgi:uncharacterized protein (TIGR02246 family)